MLFLPSGHIQETFQHLDEGTPETLAPVVDCVYKIWIRSSVCCCLVLLQIFQKVGVASKQL